MRSLIEQFKFNIEGEDPKSDFYSSVTLPKHILAERCRLEKALSAGATKVKAVFNQPDVESALDTYRGVSVNSLPPLLKTYVVAAEELHDLNTRFDEEGVAIKKNTSPESTQHLIFQEQLNRVYG